MSWAYGANVLTSTGGTEGTPDSLLAGIAAVQAADAARGYRNGYVAWLDAVEVRVAAGSFIILDDDGQFELRTSSFINPQTGGVIHGNRSTLVFLTSTSRFDSAAGLGTGSTFICRRTRPQDPSPKIIYRNTARMDYPNIVSSSVPAKVDIAGLDLYNAAGTGGGYLKMYFGLATTANVANVRLFNGGTQYYFQMYKSTYNDAYLEGLGLSSESLVSNIIFNRPTYYLAAATNFGAEIRDAAVTLRNPTFLNNCWNGTVSFVQQTANSKFNIVYTYTNTFKQGLTALENVRVRFARYRQSANGNPVSVATSQQITATSNASGTYTAVDLLDAYRVGTSATDLERYNWTAKARAYSKRTAGETVFSNRVLYQASVNMSAGYSEEVQMLSVPNLTLTEAQAAALTGMTMAVSGGIRYLMLRRNASADGFDIAEVDVFVNGTDVAAAKTVTVGPQGTYAGSTPGAMTNGGYADNGTDTYWAGGGNANSWVQIDLGQVYPVIDTIVITPRTGYVSRIQSTYCYGAASDMSTGAATTTASQTPIASAKLLLTTPASGITGAVITNGPFDIATRTVTVSGSTTTANLWHYYRQWIAQTANFDSADTWDYDGATLNIGAWSLTVNAGVTLTGDLTTTGTVTNNGTINGNYTDASGTRVTIKTTDSLALSTYLTVNGTPQAWQAGQTERYLFVTPASVVRLYAQAYGYQPTILNITGNTASDYIVKLTPETLVDTALSTTTRDAIVAHIAIGMDGSSRLFLSTDADLSAHSPDEVLNAIHYYMVTQGQLIAAASVQLNDVNTVKVIQGGIIVHSPGFYGKIADSVTTTGSMGIFAPIYIDVDPTVYVAMPTYSPVEKNTSGIVLQTARWTHQTALISATDKADIRTGLALQTGLQVINEGVKKASLLVPHSESLP